MLTIENLSKSYDEVILDNINFKFDANKIYGLVGINGAGKTTFLKSISNLDTNYTGTVKLNVIDTTDIDYLDLPIAFISDTPVLINTLTVEENLYMICAAKSIGYKESKQRIEKMLDVLDLGKYKSYFPNKLSKGTLQRANIALSLIRDELLYLLDEPFSGLDPIQVTQLQNFIINYQRNSYKIFIISSHDLESLNNICDEIVLLHDKHLTMLDKEETTREKINELLVKDYETNEN